MYRNNKTSIIGIVITIIVLIILVLLTNINTNKLDINIPITGNSNFIPFLKPKA